MTCDVFTQHQALELLRGEKVWLLGDSNTRSLYKDLVWLLQNGTLISQNSLSKRNELSHAGDKRTSNGALTRGRDYEETRLYERNEVTVTFTFLTRMFSERSVNERFLSFRRRRLTLSVFRLVTALSGDVIPDIVVINSCVWDLTRWGPKGVREYKTNLINTMELLKTHLPESTLVVFTTTLPLSPDCSGGFLRRQIEFLRYVLPWHVAEANRFLAEMAQLYRFDVLDFHYNLRFLTDEWEKDGIHWSPDAYRFMTNLLLTHVALSKERRLPGVYGLDERFVKNSQEVWKEESTIWSEKSLDFSKDEFKFSDFIEGYSPQLQTV